jgi:DNA-binding MarR family transcriptional regulator
LTNYIAELEGFIAPSDALKALRPMEKASRIDKKKGKWTQRRGFYAETTKHEKRLRRDEEFFPAHCCSQLNV